MVEPGGEELAGFLRDHGLTRVRDLVVSRRKGQHTLLVEDARGRLMVLKHRTRRDGSPFREREMYLELATPHMPELLDSGPTHLLLAHHRGESLRDRLAVGSLSDAERRALVEALVEPRASEEPARVADVRRALARALIRLLGSGPRSAPVGPGWRQAFRRLLARTVPVLLGPTLDRRARASVALGPSVHQHGDLHLDNVWMEQEGRVLVMDWEDAFVGTPICDWLYFWPQVLRMPDGEAAYRLFRSEAGRTSPAQLALFDRLLPFYDWAAKRNARFSAPDLRHP